ncbi:MAG: cytochrome-c peroxidase [Salibacteraceae bacterium]|nr:cytochrome-c peroxidase [Salibacteraceae bacterium]
MMKRLIMILGFGALLIAASHTWQSKPLKLTYPDSWPKPAYDTARNPLTEAGVWLGRNLFYDPALSNDNMISCASCHLSFTAFTHVDHALSHGIDDRIGTRNSLVLINLAWNKSFMWDGAVNHLDMQALAPISHPDEMGSSIAEVVEKLAPNPNYKMWCFQAFGDSNLTGEYVLKALAQFQLTLVSANSKYDQMQRGEITFSAQETRGYDLFKANCNSCHTEPLFTNGSFQNNGLPLDSLLGDTGRMMVTKNEADNRKFKVPTLRNIEFSKPFMHDGRFESLSQVLKHYQSGIEASSTLAKELEKNIALSETEKIDLISFLLTLSDKEFLFNTAFGYPKRK